MVKPKLGADSVGLRFTEEPELPDDADGTLLVQPRIDFRYEVSFYFVDHDFQYALHAPHPDRRWVLEPYAASSEDLDFARRFVEWNSSPTASSAWTPAGHRRVTCCSSSWRTSIRICRSTA